MFLFNIATFMYTTYLTLNTHTFLLNTRALVSEDQGKAQNKIHGQRCLRLGDPAPKPSFLITSLQNPMVFIS